MTMDRNHQSSTQKADSQLREASFHLDDGTIFTVRLSTGCEQFIGRFTRLPELQHADHIVRFQDPVLVDRDPD